MVENNDLGKVANVFLVEIANKVKIFVF